MTGARVARLHEVVNVVKEMQRGGPAHFGRFDFGLACRLTGRQEKSRRSGYQKCPEGPGIKGMGLLLMKRV